MGIVIEIQRSNNGVLFLLYKTNSIKVGGRCYVKWQKEKVEDVANIMIG
jgi:hypothetical protein